MLRDDHIGRAVRESLTEWADAADPGDRRVALRGHHNRRSVLFLGQSRPDIHQLDYKTEIIWVKADA